MEDKLQERITLAHGAGGRKTAQLISEVFAARFGNPLLTADDAAVLPALHGVPVMTTDGFIVSPRRFAGGNIGKLSICGTVNDLLCMGAVPKYLTCAMVIEEGLPVAELTEYADAMAKTAAAAGVVVVAGDTKVAGRGQVDGVYITTTGLGEKRTGVSPAGAKAQPGDKVIVSGDVGRHGCTILLARDSFGIAAEVTSDCAPLVQEAEAIFAAGEAVHVVRDATRGGVGTVLYELAGQSKVGFQLEAESIPVQPAVRGVCGMLGLEPLYLACEGRFVVVAAPEAAEGIVARLKEAPHGENAAIIGTVTAENAGRVTLTTELGTQTFLPQPTGELLPRIC